MLVALNKKVGITPFEDKVEKVQKNGFSVAKSKGTLRKTTVIAPDSEGTVGAGQVVYVRSEAVLQTSGRVDIEVDGQVIWLIDISNVFLREDPSYSINISAENSWRSYDLQTAATSDTKEP